MEALRVPLTKCESIRVKEAVCCQIQRRVNIMKQKHKKQKEEADYEEYAFYTEPEYYDYQENEDFYNYEYTEYKDTEEDYDMIFDKVTVYSHVNAPGGR